MCVGNYQPGGVAVFAGGNVAGRICASGTNKKGLGWWTYLCLNSQYNKKIWIIGTYWLGNNKSTGDETAYQQQHCLLTQQGIKNPGPSKVWDKNMLKFLDSIPQEDEIILAMDANGEIVDAKLGNLLSSTRLINTIGAMHGMNSPPTYIRGKLPLILFLPYQEC
eukprot:9731620-Ditylum_brightwellii.AAC.1